MDAYMLVSAAGVVLCRLDGKTVERPAYNESGMVDGTQLVLLARIVSGRVPDDVMMAADVFRECGEEGTLSLLAESDRFIESMGLTICHAETQTVLRVVQMARSEDTWTLYLEETERG